MIRPIRIRYAPNSSAEGSYNACNLARRLTTLTPPVPTEDGRGLFTKATSRDATEGEADADGLSSSSSSSPSSSSAALPSP